MADRAGPCDRWCKRGWVYWPDVFARCRRAPKAERVDNLAEVVGQERDVRRLNRCVRASHSPWQCRWSRQLAPEGR